MVRQRAGLMRSRITVQTATYSTNAFGEREATWSSSAVGTLWAQVETAQGTERFSSGAERTQLPTLFRVRYRADIDTDNRIQWPSTSDVYDIESVQNLEGADKVLEIRGVKHG